VVQAFHAALRAQTALELAQQSQALTERGLRVVQGAVTAGQSSPVEATRAQVQLAQAQAEVRRAQTQRSVAYQALARLTGSPLAASTGCRPPTCRPALRPAPTLARKVEKTAEWRAWPLPRSSAAMPPGAEKPSASPTSPSALAASTAAKTASG
jgi:cobalt-zinc-cadmium efflux system outer membrane protein